MSTARLGFRRWAETDVDLAIALWGDYEVTKLIDARGVLSKDQVLERLAREIASQEKHGVQYWPIFLLKNEEHVGCAGLRTYDLAGHVYEIGFHIRPNHWRCGYAFEAGRAVMSYAFMQLGVRGLFAGHNPANESSRRLLKRLGFRYTHDQYYPPTGLHHPSYLLNAEEYFAGNAAEDASSRTFP
jgi:[ribosomal protein S5]-alanine N-acetyltransferase